MDSQPYHGPRTAWRYCQIPKISRRIIGDNSLAKKNQSSKPLAQASKPSGSNTSRKPRRRRNKGRIAGLNGLTDKFSSALPRSQFDNLVEMCVQRGLGTRQGANWFTLAVDAFHDKITTCDGIPDGNNDKTTVQTLQKKFIVTPPASVVAAQGQWDARIDVGIPTLANYPAGEVAPKTGCAVVLTPGPGATASQWPVRYDKADNSKLTGYPCATVQAISVPAGSATGPCDAYDPTNVVFKTLDLNTNSGQKRFTHIGAEAALGASDYFNQGMVTVSRQPQTCEDGHICFLGSNDSPGGTGTDLCRPINGTYSEYITVLTNQDLQVCPPASNIPVTVSRMPPCNSADAYALLGALQWEAKKGAYVNATQNVRQNKFRGSKPTNMLLTKGDLGSNSQTHSFNGLVGQGAVLVMPFVSSRVATPIETESILLPLSDVVIGNNLHKPIPFDTSVMYFTGLDYRATINVTVNYGLENIPTSDNTELQGTSKVPPPVDPFFLELYEYVSQRMPAGTEVGNNESGKWWDMVLSIIQSGAPAIGAAIGPHGAIFGQLVGMAAGAGRAIINK